MKRRYILVNPWWKALAILIDFGFLFHRPPKSISEGGRFKGKPKVRKIALLILDHLGDVIFTTPAVRNLTEAYPSAEITVFVGPWAEDVYLSNPAVDRVEVFESSWFSRSGKGEGILSLARRLKEGNFDLVIDFRGDLRHIVAMWLARVPIRLGYGITGGGFLLSVMPSYPFEKHAVEKHLNLIEALGIEPSSRTLEVFVSSKFKDKVRQLLKAKGVSGNFVILHPGAGSQAKRWGWKNFFEVGKRLKEKGYHVIVSGSAGEKEEARKVSQAIGGSAFSLAGEVTLAELIALIAKAKVLIAGDTGPLHLASALGTPFVAVYSGTNRPELWGPWQGDYHLIRRDVDCAPCGKKFCSDRKCLVSITPDEVFERALSLLKK